MNFVEILNQEIARELILEINPLLTEEQFDVLWPLCKGNPWDAPIIYKLTEMKNTEL